VDSVHSILDLVAIGYAPANQYSLPKCPVRIIAQMFHPVNSEEARLAVHISASDLPPKLVSQETLAGEQ
jgi:hypothetical protein